MGLVTRSANALQATTAVRREVADYGESVSGHDFAAQLITFRPGTLRRGHGRTQRVTIWQTFPKQPHSRFRRRHNQYSPSVFRTLIYKGWKSFHLLEELPTSSKLLTLIVRKWRILLPC